jgi:periplasmic protein TonB
MHLRKYTGQLFLLSGCTAILLLSSFVKPVSDLGQLSARRVVVNDSVPVKEIDESIFQRVETEASFPGGFTGWKEFLEKNLKADVPVRKKAPVGNYTVMVQFVVDKEGNISDIKPLTDHGYGMEKEVVRILKKSPKWIPAVQNGRPVRAYRKQPVTFVVTQN